MSTPLESFFAKFADLGFEYRGNATAQSNFERLEQLPHWNGNRAGIKENQKDFNDALTQQFNVTVGSRNDLASWQRLCTLIDITPVPDNMGDCQKRVQDSHVNIVDLLEAVRTGKFPVRKFRTLQELSEYTIRTRRIFPRWSAYAGGLLKELLREIFSSYRGKKRGGGGARGRRRRARRKAAAATAAAQSSSS